MSTNPNDIVRVRARANGRASVYEANAWCQSLSQGVLDGNGVVQNTSADMNVLVGGTSSKPDVVIASNPSGYKIALDIVGQQAVAITVPASNKRITSIVAYTDDLSLASTDTSITGSPSSCGLIVVNGTASASPSAPDDATIRTAITDDGATGSQACYCVLAEILVDHTTTTITNSLIDNKISGVNQIADLAVKSNSIDWTTLASYFGDNENSFNSNSTYTTRASITVQPGTYLFFSSCTFTNGSTTGSGECYLRISGLPSGDQTRESSMINGASYQSVTTTVACVDTISSESVIKANVSIHYPERGTYTTKAKHCFIFAIRIA